MTAMVETAGTTIVTGIEWGYARVSTKKQDLHRQVHALTKYGIPAGPDSGDEQRLYVDKLTGKNFNRLAWLELRPRLRAGDVLVLAELDRLGRSQTEMLQLFTKLTTMGVHINVIGGPIPFDTRVPGPATEMAKATLIFLGQVELIYKQERVASARESGKNAHRPRKLTAQLEEDLAGDFRDGAVVAALAANYGVSRATVYRIAREHQVKNNARRTFTPAGRGKSLTPAQVGTAQRLKADGMSIRQIAAAIGSSRATVHRTLTAAPVTEIATVLAANLAAADDAVPAGGSQRLACPGCGTVPNGKIAAARLREELQTDWWSTSSTTPGRIEVTQHCGRCQPHTVHAVSCLTCGDGPLLTGELAELAHNTDPRQLPELVTTELTRSGWRWTQTQHVSGWVCCQLAVDGD
jgi:DNA invertase Pin-like site-specific DNA recombinase